MRPVHFIASLLAVFAITCGGFALGRAGAGGGPAAGGGDSFERWYVIELMGQKAGYARMVQQKNGDNIRSINEMNLLIKRGAVEMKVELASEWLETASGQAISMTSKLENGRMDDIFQSGLHEFITSFLAENNRVGNAIADQYLI